jgi:hypothetical protein
MFCATQHIGDGLEQAEDEIMVVSFGKFQHPPRSSELLFDGTMGACMAPSRPGVTWALLRRFQLDSCPFKPT